MKNNKPYHRFFASIAAGIARMQCTIHDHQRMKKQHDDALDLNIQKDICYSKDKKDRYHLLDIYQRKDADRMEPVIFVTHGGGGVYGTKDLNRYSDMVMARLGYTLIAISYPLSPKAGFYTQLESILEAMEFCKKNQETYHFSFQRIYMVGDSAGGLLSLTFALINASKKNRDLFEMEFEPFPIHALGLISTASHVKRGEESTFLFSTGIHRNDIYLDCYKELLDPTLMIKKDIMPPCVLITSDHDFLKKDSYDLYDCMRKNGIEVEFREYKSEDFRLEHVFPIAYPERKESKDAFFLFDSFFQSC